MPLNCPSRPFSGPPNGEKLSRHAVAEQRHDGKRKTATLLMLSVCLSRIYKYTHGGNHHSGERMMESRKRHYFVNNNKA